MPQEIQMFLGRGQECLCVRQDTLQEKLSPGHHYSNKSPLPEEGAALESASLGHHWSLPTQPLWTWELPQLHCSPHGHLVGHLTPAL